MLFNELQNGFECFLADRVFQFPLKYLVDLLIDKLFDRDCGLVALEHRRDVLSEAQLQCGNRIEHRRARAAR